MPLKRLIYVSLVATAMSEHELRRLQALSERNNRRLDVTGALGYTGRYFIQCIEGRAEAIDQLMVRIAADPRHTNVLELCTAQADKRRFAQWSMRYFDSHALDVDTHGVHQAGRQDSDRANWLIERMTQTLAPGQSLHDI